MCVHCIIQLLGLVYETVEPEQITIFRQTIIQPSAKIVKTEKNPMGLDYR